MLSKTTIKGETPCDCSGSEGERLALTGPRWASVPGFSFHAHVAVPAHRRDQWERLIRSTARGAVSLERLEADEGGDLLYPFTRPWSEGTTGITRSPWARLETLAALGPLPRRHLVRSGGGLAPPSPRRRLLPPTPRQPGLTVPAAGAAPSWSWARLLQRVCAFAMARCPAWGRGTLRLLAALTQAAVIRTMLRHLTRAADPPPLAPARAGQDRVAWAGAHRA